MSYYKRNLPHYQQAGYAYFITTRLAGTIPKEAYLRIKGYYEKGVERISRMNDGKKKNALYRDLQNEEFLKYENLLHSLKFGRQWLRDDRIAKVVFDTLVYYKNNRYNLIASTIMPNHVHLIIYPFVKRKSSFAEDSNYNKTKRPITDSDNTYFLTKILQDIKRYSAKECNKILNRSGQFWHHESYDHVIRDKEELIRLVKYTLNNPVKAKLCNTPEEWKWNYYNTKFLV